VDATCRVGHSDPCEQFDRFPVRFRAGRWPVGLQRFGDLLAYRKRRVERGERILEDHANAGAANQLHVTLVEREQVAAVERHRS